MIVFEFFDFGGKKRRKWTQTDAFQSEGRSYRERPQKYNAQGYPVFGSNIYEWVQTKPPEIIKKKIDFSKCKWNYQFTLNDIDIQQRENGLLFVIPLIDFVIFLTWNNIMVSHQIFKSRPPELKREQIITALIEASILPYPMEELITLKS